MKFISKSVLGLMLMTMVATAAQAAPTNDELKIGINQEFENLNPLIGSMAATSYMSYLANRNMVILDSNSKWIPNLAKSIPSIENGGAKLTDVGGKKTLVATWEIIDNAKWGDGTPITCADIKFTWEIGKNPNVSVPSRDAYENIKSIVWEPATPKKCVLTYEKAKWDFYKEMLSPMPKHIDEANFKKYGNKKEGYDQNSAFQKTPTNPGLYSGPYVVSEIKLGSHVTFSANPHFYGQAPKIKKIIFKLIPNTATLEANLRSGTIDMICPLGLTFDQALALDKKIKADKLPYNVIFQPAITYEHIDLDLDNPILKDIKVRRALVHAINRQELVQALFEGRQKSAVHNVSPIDGWYTEDPKFVKQYPFSKREAARLLDEAGWKMGADGYRSKDGKKLSLQFMTTAGNKTRETVQTLLQGQWKSVGVEVVIKNEPARVFFGETTKKRNYGAMAMYAWIATPENASRTTMHSSQVVSEKNNWTGQNYTGWSNKNVDTLLDQMDVEFNADKRKQIAYELVKYYTEDVPVIPLYYRADIAVVPTNLSGYKLPGHLYYETNQAEKWDLGSSVK